MPEAGGSEVARRVYVRDLNTLLHLDRSLGEFASCAQGILDEVQKEVRANKEWLAERRRYWSNEVERRRQVYEACLRQQDRNNYGGGCGTEAAALRRAEEGLELTRRWIARVEQAAGEYAPYAERMRQLGASRVNRARADISQSIAKYRDDISRRAIGLPVGYRGPQVIGDRMPRSYLYADSIYSFKRSKPRRYASLAAKYPRGVAFDAYGFLDFSPYATATVEIDMKGNRTTDFRDANKKAGFRRPPKGYSWHHHQDGKTMQLVPTDLHKNVPHTGGVSIKRQVE